MKQTIYIPVKEEEVEELDIVKILSDKLSVMQTSERFEPSIVGLGYAAKGVLELFKPVEMPNEEEINQAIELLLASYLTLMDTNEFSNNWPNRHIAKRSFEEKKLAITKLMKGEK